MISKSPSSLGTKAEQLARFLDTPTPESVLEPSAERSCLNHRVHAVRQGDGSFVLFARSDVKQGEGPDTQADLHQFLDDMAKELRHKKGHRADRALAEMRRTMLHWHSQAPTVGDLRELNAQLNDGLVAVQAPPSEFTLRKRAQLRTAAFEKALGEQLQALSEHDPRRDDLQKAGDQLATMLHAPDATISLKSVSPATLGLLIDTGLMARFADLRQGVDPLPVRLTLSTHARDLLPRLPPFPSVRTVIFHQSHT